MFRSYSKEKFEYELNRIRWDNNLKYAKWYDVTDELNNVYEHVYEMRTNVPFINIVIFSSVDLNTGATRDIGSDAVRVVYKKTGMYGTFYKYVRKHLRIETLFNNLENTLVQAYDSKASVYEDGWCRGYNQWQTIK